MMERIFASNAASLKALIISSHIQPELRGTFQQKKAPGIRPALFLFLLLRGVELKFYAVGRGRLMSAFADKE